MGDRPPERGPAAAVGGADKMDSNTLLLDFLPTLTMMAVSLLVGCVVVARGTTTAT